VEKSAGKINRECGILGLMDTSKTLVYNRSTQDICTRSKHTKFDIGNTMDGRNDNKLGRLQIFVSKCTNPKNKIKSNLPSCSPLVVEESTSPLQVDSPSEPVPLPKYPFGTV
jgi:hypothetical protein